MVRFARKGCSAAESVVNRAYKPQLAGFSLGDAVTVGLMLAAGLQCILGIVGFLVMYQSLDWEHLRHGALSIQTAVRVVASILLFSAGTGDRRTLLFGAALVFNATALARTGCGFLAEYSASRPLALFFSIPFDALFPYYFWCFARTFPDAFLPYSLDRTLGWVETFVLALGLFLVIANVWHGLLPQAAWLGVFSASDPRGAFSGLVYGLAFPVLGVILLRMRSARQNERRRVRVFILGLLVTLAPILLFIILTSLSDTLAEFVLREDIWVLIFPMMQLLVLATPMITTYAVLVERILPVRILLRQTLRYSLGGGFLVLGSLLPVLLLLFYLYTLRTLSIETLTSGTSGLFVAIALGSSLFLISRRQRGQRYLDELFYRDGYDANTLLARLAERVQGSDNLAELAHAAREAVDASVHPENCHLLFVIDDGTLHDPLQELSDLQLATPGRDQFQQLTEPVAVKNLGVDADAQRWLAGANTDYLVPVPGRTSAHGLILLGRKRSELPYTAADLNFLGVVASSMAVRCTGLLDDWYQGDSELTTPECADCGALVVENRPCPACGGTQWERGLLPAVLHHHYEVRHNIGQGMGAVYLGHDRRLDRPVVLKTITRATAEESTFLRDEARLMAQLQHAHIATIYGYESFQGMPILVCEYLENGTLHDIIRNGYLERDELTEITAQIAQALAYLHRRGIVHGDIKPSNIGFDAEEKAKLLDFGLAGLNRPSLDGKPRGGGTYAYMSPEAILGQKTDHRVDLWALAVTLLEALHGHNPFQAADLEGTVARIRKPRRTVESALDPPSAFLLEALNPDISRRPENAEKFMRMMLEMGW